MVVRNGSTTYSGTGFWCYLSVFFYIHTYYCRVGVRVRTCLVLHAWYDIPETGAGSPWEKEHIRST